MASILAALGSAHIVSTLFNHPFRSTATIATALGAYYYTNNSGFMTEVNGVAERISSISDHFKRALVVAFTTPLALAKLTWQTIAHAFVSFLTSIGVIPLSIYTALIACLVAVGKVMTSVKDEISEVLSSQPPVMVAQSDTPPPAEPVTPKSTITSVVTLIFTGFCMAYGIQASKPKNFGEWISTMCDKITWHGTKFTSLSTFFSATINFLRDLVDWGTAKISRADVLTRLSTNRPEIIDAWLSEVDLLTHPSYEDKIFNSPEWMKRVFQAADLGDLIFRDVMRERPVKCPIPGLVKRYGDLKRLRDRCVSWSTAVSVRQEPYCVWIYGDSGIGKSQVSNYVGYSICKGSNIEILGNPIYDIQPGTNFWTGCQGKKIARFDDFSILRGERGVEDLSAFMRLKSPAIFISEQAEIEDKGKPWAPVGVVVNSNIGFPRPMELCTPEAFFRRRDALYEACYRDELADCVGKPFNDADVQEAIKAWRGDKPAQHFDWLQFKKYRNPADSSSPVAKVLNYEQLLQEIEEDTASYRKQQEELYLRALEEITSLQPEVVTDYPLAQCLEIIRNNTTTFFCSLSDKTPSFVEWCKDLTSLGVSKEDSLADLQATADEVANEINIVGQSDIPEEAKEQKASLLVRCSKSLTNYVSNIIHKTSSMCHCSDDFTKARLRAKCVHYQKLDIFSHSNPLWRKVRDGFTTIDGECHIPLICSHDCVFNERGIRQCLRESKSWVTSNSDDSWIVAEQESDPSNDSKLKKYLEFMKSKAGIALSAIYNVLKSAYTYIIAALCIGGYFLYKKITSKKSEPPPAIVTPSQEEFFEKPVIRPLKKGVPDEGQIIHSGDPGSSKLKRATQGVQLKSFNRIASAKAGQMTQNIHHILRKNIIWMRPEWSNKPWRCYGLCQYYVLTLKHYWADAEDSARNIGLDYMDYKMLVYKTNADGIVSKVEVPMSSIEHYECPDSEYRIIKVPPHCTTMFKDIRHHFGSKHAFENCYYPRTGEAFNHKLDTVEIVPLCLEYPITAQPVITSTGKQTSAVMRPIRYAWSAPGRCMTPILGYMGGRQYILGFHVAGSKNLNIQLGIAEPLFCDDLTALTEKNDLPLSVEDFPEVGMEAQAGITIRSNVVPIAVINDYYAQARKSRIVPSHLASFLDEGDEPKTAPAPLCRDQVPNKAFDPMEEGVNFHGEPTLPCNPELYRRAHEDYTDMILHNCRPVMGARVLTMEEAICGIPSVHFKSMVLSTSEGYPYIFHRPKDVECNKRWLIERETINGQSVLKSVHQIVREAMRHKEQLRSKGIIPITVFADCLKDARIPIYKLSKPGATRVFSVSPVDFTIQFRQYFGAFLQAYKENRLNCEHAVGINVQSAEWTLLAQKLAGDGFTKFLDGDFSKFGPRLDPQDSLDFCDTINAWYKKHSDDLPENVDYDNRIRKIMILEACQAKHLCRNLVYQTMVGMPSGFPGTVEWNNASNAKGIRRAWLDCWKDDPTMCNMPAFREHVRLFTYGDDIVVGISDLAATKFNNIFLSEYYARHGMKYTSAQKGDVSLPYVSLEELSFLKHKWSPHPNRPPFYIAKIEEQSIHECYKWIHDDGTLATSIDKIEPTLVNCEMALLLSYGHGPEFYTNLRRKLTDWYEKAHLEYPNLRRPQFYSWNELDKIFWPLDINDVDPEQVESILNKYQQYLGDTVMLQLEY